MRIFLTIKSVLVAILVLTATAILQGAQAATITIEHPWSWATPAGASNGAVFMTIRNRGTDSERLIGGSSPAASVIQVHEMTVINNVMHMREVPGGLPVPPSGSVTLKPGSYHIMLIGLKAPLKVGDVISLTLQFDRSGTIDVSVPVLAMGTIPDEAK